MKVMVSNVRIAFPELFQPKAFQDSEPAFSAVLAVDPANKVNVSMLDDAMAQAAKDKWGDRAPGILKDLVSKGRVGFVKAPKTTSGGEVLDGFDGMFTLSTRSKPNQPPLILDRDRTKLTTDTGRIYGGCYVNASVSCWAQDNQFGKRINFQLLGVQFVRDGDAFTGGGRATPDDFADVPEDDLADIMG